MSEEQQGISHKAVFSLSPAVLRPHGMGQRSARRTSCLCHYSRLHFCQRTSTANPVSPFLWPKGLTQRVRPKATLCRKDVSPPGLPSHALPSPRCTSCAVSTLNLSLFPGRLGLLQCWALAPVCPEESRTFFGSTLTPWHRVPLFISRNSVCTGWQGLLAYSGWSSASST